MFLFISPVILGLFLFISQPLLLVVLLVMQTIPIILVGIVCSESRWLSYITFLIYLGGLLIIFIYISALVPNQLTTFSWLGTRAGCLVGVVIYATTWVEQRKVNRRISSVVDFALINSSRYIILIIVYLLLILFSVAGLTNFIKSPLKAY